MELYTKEVLTSLDKLGLNSVEQVVPKGVSVSCEWGHCCWRSEIPWLTTTLVRQFRGNLSACYLCLFFFFFFFFFDYSLDK